MSLIRKSKIILKRTIKFLTYDIWRLTGSEIPTRKINLFNIIKSFILAFRNIDSSGLNTRAGALTYQTLLSIVPLLAVLFAIARGFGLQNIVKSELFSYFSAQEEVLDKAFEFIDKSLEYAQGGVFLGIGIVLLLYTVINLISSIEDNFNRIWGIKKGRSYYRQITDYTALMILAPVFLICNSGLSILLSASAEDALIGLVISPIIKIIPFVLTIGIFTFFYAYIPNTKVKFSAALLAGVVTGIIFQIFQLLYISGQIWISKYNAIYGSFAALPLLLLWLQLSWFILLIGVELSFAFQNVDKFNFEHETKNISRRYKIFVTLIITSLIVKRFEKGLKPYTADEISMKHKIPTRLTADAIYSLLEIGIILETPTDDIRVPAYIPAIDINQISIGFLFDRIYLFGSEDFVIDRDKEFKNEWAEMLKVHDIISNDEGRKLIKDL